MQSIDYEDHERQSCGCRWDFSTSRHHDVWLEKLTKLDGYSRASLGRENVEQAHCPNLPASIIPMVDIHDFALAHRQQLSDEAIDVAEQLRYLAGRAMLPLKDLQFDAVLADAGTRGGYEWS